MLTGPLKLTLARVPHLRVSLRATRGQAGDRVGSVMFKRIHSEKWRLHS